MEPEYGRSRVFAQWLNTEDDLQAAIGEQSLRCFWRAPFAALSLWQHLLAALSLSQSATVWQHLLASPRPALSSA